MSELIIKELLITLLVLCMLMATDDFRLESITSKTADGGTSIQVHQGQCILIGYHSKRLQQIACNYGIAEIELTGLVSNICGFSQLHKYQYFNVLIDHKAIEKL